MKSLQIGVLSAVALLALCGVGYCDDNAAGNVIRLGVIGLDTSHAVVFTQMLNDPNHKEYVPGAKVTAGFKGGSADIPSSIERVDEYTKELEEKWGVKLYDSVSELCKNVDGVLIESVDGRPHLEYAKQVIEAGLPFFVDKPIAGTYKDVLEIAKLAQKANIPWFGGSSLRWWSGLKAACDPAKIGEVLGCDACSPCELESHHPDLFWYGVHGVSILYGAMGPGCKQVTRVSTKETDFVVGVWADGRIGTMRGTRNGQYDLAATIFGSKANVATEKSFSYKGLVEQLVKFFQTKKAPIAAEEMIEEYAFMEAADLSKKEGGKPVDLPDMSIQ